MLTGVLIFLALGVAMVYFTIAAFVVPRIQLPGASPRFAGLFTVGAVAFFVGCGLTHLHIAVDAFSNPREVGLHEIGFHVLQFVGGTLFVWAAFRFLDIEVAVKKTKEEHRIDQLEELAVRDPLTGAYNRRFFEEQLGMASARHRREGEPFAIAHIDIDNFKSVNDRYGHGVGDAVLKRLVIATNELIRPTDTLVRFGGDEFGLLLPNTEGETALAIVDRVRRSVAVAPSEGLPSVTVSVGMASCPEHGSVLDELLERSDAALYRSKRDGKNRSTVSVAHRAPAVL